MAVANTRCGAGRAAAALRCARATLTQSGGGLGWSVLVTRHLALRFLSCIMAKHSQVGGAGRAAAALRCTKVHLTISQVGGFAAVVSLVLCCWSAYSASVLCKVQAVRRHSEVRACGLMLEYVSSYRHTHCRYVLACRVVASAFALAGWDPTTGGLRWTSSLVAPFC
jgi:hypothetical protein